MSSVIAVTMQNVNCMVKGCFKTHQETKMHNIGIERIPATGSS